MIGLNNQKNKQNEYMSFPKRIPQHKNEDLSYAIIEDRMHEIGVFRNFTNHDYGIDFEIEIEVDGRMEGHSLKVQIKSSDDLSIRKDGHATVGGIKQSTLNYWAEISFSQPVVGMAVDLVGENKIYVSDLLFWQIIQQIEPSGDVEKRDDKGHIIQPPTKTVDFGCCSDIQKNMDKLRHYAYGFSLRDFLNAHKWILLNLKNIFKMYEDAMTCDQFMPIYEPKLFKMFLQQVKAFVYYDLGFREKGEKLDIVFDYNYYIKKSNGDDPYNIEVAQGMKIILSNMMLPLLQQYRNLVFNSSYYWINKDLDYLKLVFDTDFPDWNNEEDMLRFGYDESEEDWGNSSWLSFIDQQQERYGITDNSLISKALR